MCLQPPIYLYHGHRENCAKYVSDVLSWLAKYVEQTISNRHYNRDESFQSFHYFQGFSLSLQKWYTLNMTHRVNLYIKVRVVWGRCSMFAIAAVFSEFLNHNLMISATPSHFVEYFLRNKQNFSNYIGHFINQQWGPHRLMVCVCPDHLSLFFLIFHQGHFITLKKISKCFKIMSSNISAFNLCILI